MLEAVHLNPLNTLVDLLQNRALERAGSRLYTFLNDDGSTAGSVTYGALDRQARRIAGHLQKRSSAGDRVALLYPPGLDYIAGFFGCVYAGRIAVPAYPPNPARVERTLPRLRAMIADAGATVVFTTSPILAMAEALFELAPDLRALTWIATDNLPEASEEPWQRPLIHANSIAFLQYTSGSTGQPKGVMLTHDNLLHNLGLIARGFRLDSNSSGVVWLPPYHDMGLIGGILSPLYSGYPMALLSPMAFLRRPLVWLEALSRFAATVGGGPNFAYELCVRKSTPEERRALNLSRWDVAFTGAEPIRQETLARFEQAFGASGFRREAFYPCYGLAEGTLIVSGAVKGAGPVTGQTAASDEGDGARAYIGCGQALGDQRVLVVDPGSREARPEGVEGEIWVEGRSVARGYWNRAEESEHTFRARPHGAASGAFLRTGDLGFLRDGELYVTGRLKDLLIVRGRNHHPQDIELTMERCHSALRPGCAAAFSVEVGSEERLVVVQELDAARDPSLDCESLLAVVRQRIAEEHELAVHALVLIAPGTISKTSSGKIQRRATREAFLNDELRVLVAWRESVEAVVPAPVDAADISDESLEAWLTERAARLLRVPVASLDVREPLTRYGLDSLAAVELAHEVEGAFQVDAGLSALLGGASIAELARQVEGARREVGEDRARAGGEEEEEEGGGGYPLSFAQEGMWILGQLEGGGAAYNIPVALHVEGALDAMALRRAFEALVRRHPVLRASFHLEQGRPMQRVGAASPWHLPIVDLSGGSREERDAEMVRRAAQEALAPFDLTRGPLVRTKLLRLAEGEHVLLLTVHHSVADGLSMAAMERELRALYAACLQGEPAQLPAVRRSFWEHVAAQHAELASPVVRAKLRTWQERLAGAPALELPTLGARPNVRTFRGGQVTVPLGDRLPQALKAWSRGCGVTPFMTMLAAFQVVLHRYSGQKDICVGSPVAARGAGWADAIGCIVNTVVLRTSLEGNPTFRELLGRVQEATLFALSNQRVPFEKVVDALQSERDPSHSPLFQAMMVVQPEVEPIEPWSGLRRMRLLELESGTSKYDISLILREGPAGYRAWLEYNTDLFDRALVERMAAHLRTVIERVADGLEGRLSDLVRSSEGERTTLLVDFHAPLRGENAAGQDARAVHQLFEAQAARTPDAIAVVFEDMSLTYRELDQRANRLAARLRAAGAGGSSDEHVVAVALERSWELVVSLLGILKAGAAYMPLDPAHPRERQLFMLRDAGVQFLVTQWFLAEDLPVEGMHVVHPDGTGMHDMHDDLVPDVEGVSPAAGSGGDRAAYVLYTSGSTGEPKGVVVTHRNVVSLFEALDRSVGTGPEQTWLALTNLSFDVSVPELLWTLARGSKIVVLGEDELLARRNAPSAGERSAKERRRYGVAAQLIRHRVTHLQCTPSLARALLADAEIVRALSPLRAILLAGEALPPALADTLAATLRDGQVWNLYGPTEATVYATAHRVVPGSAVVPIGAPLPNTRLYVLDGHGELTPLGVAGELFIGGEGVARGYLARPELTAERFVRDPFAATDGARMYRTGDRARWRSDGTMEFLGRLDHQVKIRGIRIELGEVESVLAKHPAVQSAAVVARAVGANEAELIAYAVSRPGAELQASRSKIFCASGCPMRWFPQSSSRWPSCRSMRRAR